MIPIPGYQVSEKLYESPRSLVYRAQRDADRVAVILKVWRQEYPSPLAIARFQMEYNILRSLDLPGVVQAYGLEAYQQSPVLVLEDFGGESLNTWLQHRVFNLEEFLTLAIQITSILSEIHQRHTIHKDINPSNILLNPLTGQVKLIDFGIATVLSQENSGLCNPAILEGTLGYMSPEQTGRMNRAMDYRTDFYSLGVTFYQLLCDRLPFETTDALELIHCHIAKQPLPPCELNAAIPRPLSDLVIKLLAKTAEDRYQSAQGIGVDLQECLSQLQQFHHIEPFPVGQWDSSSKFQIPQKLYGREREVAELLAACDRVSRSPGPMNQRNQHAEMILVSGFPGTGKTTLVQELHRPIAQRRGYLITGNYDQLQRDTPYFALIQAFQELIRHLLTETTTQIQHWQERLLTALGDNSQVIIEVIPDVELILGQQPEGIELSAIEAQNRFRLVFEQFIRVFTQPVDRAGVDHPPPLIIFLDNLQWADRPSLQLLQQLVTSLTGQNLLLIGAYRDNEVEPVHPLLQMQEEIRHAGGTVHQIALSSLELSDVNHLLQETLHCDAERTLPLAELIIQKTEGNPCFVNEFLKFLHQEKLVDFNTHYGVWQWDLGQIQAAQLPDTLVEFVGERIQQLPEQSQRVLSLAACIGRQFDIQTLALVQGQSPLKVAADLRIATQQGLITPIGSDYKYLESYPALPEVDLQVTYQFLHDRIQQTAYALIPQSDKSQYHLNIGQLLLQSTSKESLKDQIFDIVNHLNIGSQLLTQPDQKDELAQLNWIAGQKAKAAIAYESALRYLNLGRALLAEQSWQRNYELTLKLNESAAEAAYLTGDFEQMEQRVAEVLHHAKTPLEQTKVYLVKIQSYIAQNQLMDAIQAAVQALELLGVNLPDRPTSQDIAQGLTETKQILAETPVEHLVDLPEMTDPYQLAAMRIIASVCTPTYFLAPDLWKMMVFQKVQLSVRYGNAPGSAFGYADYGMIQCGVEENIAAASQFSQLASTLQSQLSVKEFIPKTTLLVNMYLKHWQEHLKETLNPLLEVYHCGLETGDLEYATFAIAFRFYHAYLLGRELTQLEQEIAHYEPAIVQFKQALPLNLVRIYRQAVLNLLGQSSHPWRLVGSSYNEDASLTQLLEANDNYTLFHLTLNQLMLCYLFQNMVQAAAHAETADTLLLKGAVGLLVVPVFPFYDSLTKLAIFPEVSHPQQQQILQKVAANQAKMQHWADYAPMNYLHKFHLVEAERYRIAAQDAEAADAYDRAIDLARESEYLNEEALANELAGRFYLAKNKPKIAQAYLLDARYGYLRWGATAKVEDLDRRYPQFFDRLLEKTSTATQGASLPTVSSSTATAALDLAALMKASQALSDEIVLDKLLTKLMMILMENAGAERGCLILESNGKLYIEAEGRVDPDSISVLQALSMDSEGVSDRVASAIVNYVARTQESVVLNHATQDYRYNQDPYIQRYQPKSILCTPLLHQGRLSGVLYLENNLTTDAFTPNRLEILRFLSTQAAISIDNAQLYNQLELRVQERTVQLTQTNDRLQTEILERQHSEQVLRLILKGTASTIGEDFFRSLVRSLAQALHVRYALISACVDTAATRVRTVAFWQGTEFGENFEYDLVDTPCEQVVSGKGCQFYAADIQSLFPNDSALKDWQAESYLGIALLNSAGQTLGHLAVLDEHPLEDEPRSRAVLEIFAARAAAELERQQAEKALQMSEAKFSTAFRSSPDAITISTLNNGCYIEVNDSCLKMLGYGREEMIGRSALDLEIWAQPEDREAIKQLLQQQGAVANLEIKLRRKSGELFPALFSAEVIHLEEEPCLLTVAADITKLKQAEKALERLAEIGELAAMIVHEVRNPLTTIAMGLNSFKKLQLSQRFQEYLALSLDEADRLQRLLNQILLYARPQTLQRSQVELNRLIAETLTALQTSPAAMGKHLKLIAPTEVITVSADRDKLRQVLINLVTNACEAVKEDEVITVQVQQVDNHQVCLQVHNGGEPIPADILPKLTKPFFTTKVSGTGLGLAIVKRIVEAHDGKFKIESHAATGTTVKVHFPATRVASL